MPTSWLVLAKSGLLCIGLCLATLTLEWLLRPVVHDRALRWAIAFSALQVLAIVGMALFLLLRRAYTQWQTGLHEQMRPSIEERVMALALTGETWTTRVPKSGAARHVLEQCIARALTGLRDSGRDRVAQFACDHGFAREWTTAFSSHAVDRRKRAVILLGSASRVAGETVLKAALQDKDSGVRTEAARALLVAGDRESAGRIFRLMLRESLLTRALLTSDLKRHARHLLSDTLPAVLAGDDPIEVRNCLELLTVWRLAIPAFDVSPWFDKARFHKARSGKDHHASFLPFLVALLPYVPVADSMEDHLLSALESADVDVQCAAARTAGELKLNRLIPALVQLLNRNARLAIAAANALAQMGSQGARSLEMIVTGSDRKAAPVAMEALETMTVGTP